MSVDVLEEKDSLNGEFPQTDGEYIQKRVLIMMTDTGGGHRASAEAIKQAFEQEFGDRYLVLVVDFWKDHTPWPLKHLVDSYDFMVKHEFLWKAAFNFYKNPAMHHTHLSIAAALAANKVAEGFRIYQPDIIVSVHPLMQQIPLQIMQSMGLLQSIPFTSVVTDLSTCHPTWFHKLTTMCFCPTKEVADQASICGLKQNQIKVFGLPIRPSFSRELVGKAQLRQELEMDADLPAVLLVGGGEGMGPVEATAKALAKSLGSSREAPLGQLIVVCGRNKRLQNRLLSIDWPMPTKINGFVSNMPELMSSCDCIITKAGPGTIAEAMIKGLPIIINGYISGQETGNVPYVVDNGAGKFCQDPEKIAEIVYDWFGPNTKELLEMAENSRKLARPDAVIKIVHGLDQLLQKKHAGEKEKESKEKDSTLKLMETDNNKVCTLSAEILCA